MLAKSIFPPKRRVIYELQNYTLPEELKLFLRVLSLGDNEVSVGFVPTMGALHQGHRQLLKRSKAENEISVLSIFVNPTQFNNSEDLEKYPKNWETDLQVAQEEGVDILFAPDYSEMYPDNYRYQVGEKEFSKILCGKDRPGHFDGVLTVVLKLFNLIQPTRAYFGEKDYQQIETSPGNGKGLLSQRQSYTCVDSS